MRTLPRGAVTCLFAFNEQVKLSWSVGGFELHESDQVSSAWCYHSTLKSWGKVSWLSQALEPSVRAAALVSCPRLAHFIRKTHKIANAFLLTAPLSPSGRQDSEVQRSSSLGESHFRSYIVRGVTRASPTIKKALVEVEPSHLGYELLSGGANMGKAL